jgi:hypothetical protein
MEQRMVPVQERLGVRESKAQRFTDLAAREPAIAITFQHERFKHPPWHLAFRPEVLGDIVRDLYDYFHKAFEFA